MTQADLREIDMALTFLMIVIPLALLIPRIAVLVAEYRERRRRNRIAAKIGGGDDR